MHTILLAERSRLDAERGRAAFVSQHDFALYCPIARHLLQDAAALMLRLCRPDAGVERHSVLDTVLYIMEAFFALEDARLQTRHRRLMSIYGGDPADTLPSPGGGGGAGGGGRASLFLSLVFNVPLCLLMLECIAQSAHWPSGAAAAQLTAAQTAYYQAMDRQRLVMCRLVTRVLALKARYMDEQTATHLLAPTFLPSPSPPTHHPHSLSLPRRAARRPPLPLVLAPPSPLPPRLHPPVHDDRHRVGGLRRPWRRLRGRAGAAHALRHGGSGPGAGVGQVPAAAVPLRAGADGAVAPRAGGGAGAL